MKPFNFLACSCSNSSLYNPFKNMEVKSQIIDFGTNLPIENVNVYIKNNPTVGTITDANGNFSLTALPDDTIVLSHVSYGTIEIPANNTFPVEQMHEADNNLAEIDLGVFEKAKSWGWGIAAAAIGLFWIASSGEDEKKPAKKAKSPVKATV